MSTPTDTSPRTAENPERTPIVPLTVSFLPASHDLHSSDSFDSLLSEDILASPIVSTPLFTAIQAPDQNVPLTGTHLLLNSAHMCSSPPTTATNDVSIDIPSDLTLRRTRESQEQPTDSVAATVPLTNGGDEQKVEKNLWSDSNSIVLPIAGLLTSLLFPPAGCIIFCLSLGAPDDSPRYRWSVRALYLGSFLSFIYSLLITMMVSEFYLATADKDLLYGISYS